ncbi:MAG: hypothetical protein GY705_16790 [Bacteroidetes bacterium]|nr:hypothetical protein [Bacteroidota bacterium]
MTRKKGIAPVNKHQIIIFPILLSLGWLTVIVMDYLFHHPYYTQGISQFSYWGLLAILSVVSFAGYYFSRTFNGIKAYLFLLLFMNIILAWYGIANGLFESNPLVHLLYFSGFVIMLHAAVLYIVVVGYAIGDILLRPFASYFSESSQKIIAIALGLSLMGFILVVLGLINGLRPWILWPVFILATAFQYRSIGRFLKGLFFSPWPKDKLKTEGFLAGTLLMIFAAVNCIGAIKAFPIGFDGSALYMNTTKLISEYQALPEGGQAFNWSVIMSLGNLLFGSTTVSILLSHLAGLICLPVIYRIARLFVAPGNALLAAALFYTAPAITFHNFFDEKVDLGFLFISLSTLLFLLEFFLKKRKENTLKTQQFPIKIGSLVLSTDLLLWIYAGWLTGFAFGIKYIALFNGIALVVLLFYKKGGRMAFLGSLVAVLSFIFYLGIYRFAGFELEGMSPVFLGSLLFIPGMALMWWSFRQSYFHFLRTGGIAFAFLVAAGFAYSPWCVKHILENKSLSISALVEGKSPKPNIFVGGKYRKKMQNPDASKLHKKQNSPKEPAINTIAAKKTRREELQRYQGFEKGLPLYLSLPYDLTMNTNLPGLPYLDIGFLWLLLLPLLCFSAKPRNKIKNLLLLLMTGLMVFVSLLSVYVTNVKPVLPGKLVDAHPEGFRKIFGGVYKFSMDLLINLAENARGIFDWLTHFDFAAGF